MPATGFGARTFPAKRRVLWGAGRSLASLFFGDFCGCEHPGSDEFEELFLGDFEVLGELLRTQVSRHGALQGLTVGSHEFQGVTMVLFQGAGPGSL